MKTIFLTFAILTLSFATAQTVQYKDGTGQIQTKVATKLYQYPNGELKTGQEVANDWNNYWAQKSQVSSPPVNPQQPTIVYVQTPAPQPSAYEQAVIENIEADTRQKNTGTVLNVVSTGINAFTAISTTLNNNKIVNASVYGGNRGYINQNPNWNVQQPYHPNDVYMNNASSVPANNVTVLNPNQVFITQQGQNLAWAGNVGGSQPIMPQTYGWCGN